VKAESAAYIFVFIRKFESFDGDNLATARAEGRYKAGGTYRAVEYYGASPATPAETAVVTACQPKIITQYVY
jgi:hypothetical protein